MAGRYRKARAGEQVVVRGTSIPFTFWPEAYLERGRVVTTDPWVCLLSHVRQTVKNTTRRNRAVAFLEQAEDFFHAASAPRMASKPLLYYYSFLNLAKALLAVRTSLDLSRCVHGLSEASFNIRKRMTITSQAVQVHAAGGNRVKLYREFMKECGFPCQRRLKPIKVVDLLEQIVGIHPITSHTLRRKKQYFRISDAEFLCDPSNKTAWITLSVEKSEMDKQAAGEVRRNTGAFEEVEAKNPKKYRQYESNPMVYRKSPMQVLRNLVVSTWQDIWSELRPGGCRFWLSSVPSGKRRAQLASGYQAMFYFGSVSRYRPDAYRKLAEGKHGWMVQEFINTQPIQFVYFLGSGLMEAEMVAPELALAMR